ncbi:phage tail protein [Flavivirga aquatica]|uniref:Phage tail protein n=1 Tax=Flavivirga aquatica TaxID=1849968 RepID=A0A1E5SIC5_9FLAO|nr:tail fiber protein [Flavivirga aquatica]OEJ98868.1 phage tail protein [Flavivirga aquatica]
MEPFLAEIIMFAGNFAPRGWALCNGQLLPIAQNTALFSLLGTTYGGDGRTTFALPDLRGRIAMHEGTGPGLSPVRLGQRGGSELVVLTTNELPNHNHSGSTLNGSVSVNEVDGYSDEPAGRNIGISPTDTPYNDKVTDRTMAADSVNITGNTSNTGGSRPFSIRNPYLGVNYIIALQGIFPSRS